MQVPSTRGFALLFTVLLAACDTHATTGLAGGNTATVRFVNATGTSLDVASGGTLAAGNSALSYGGVSSCISVDATTSDFTVSAAGTNSQLAGIPTNFAAASKYIVIAYLDANGVTQFATFATSGSTPGSGNGGLRVFDAAPGTGNLDVYVTAPGAALGTASATNLTFGSSTNFFDATTGTQQVRLTNTGTQNVAFNAGNQTITGGRNSVLVIAPPATGSTELRSFLVTGC